MATDAAIRVTHLSKKYQLFDSKAHRVREALHPLRRTYHREFWALKDINLEIPKGLTVGILGLNGSGKSTLLQIIASVLEPTAGTVQVDGKVAALLDLGAGLNPDLTGRENVVLSGTIMGLSREQILERMDEIESFADIGQFFDQPMRTYSSGMFMRVAFSTTIYVDPEILLIDEVLSVGDIKFQEKCFRRLRGLQEAGKTILIATHDRSMVPRICELGLVLHQGELVELGEPARIIDLYGQLLAFGQVQDETAVPGVNLTSVESVDACTQPTREVVDPIKAFLENPSVEDRCNLNPTYNKYEQRSGDGHCEIIDFLIQEGSNLNPSSIYAGGHVDIYAKVRFHSEVESPIFGLEFMNKEGVILYGINTEMMMKSLESGRPGSIRCYRFRVRAALSPGDWFIYFCIARSSTELCDYRCALSHLHVMEQHRYTGLTRFETEFRELEATDPFP